MVMYATFGTWRVEGLEPGGGTLHRPLAARTRARMPEAVSGMMSSSGEEEKVVRERRGGRMITTSSIKLPTRELNRLPRHKATDVRRKREAWMGKPMSKISWGVVPSPLDTKSTWRC